MNREMVRGWQNLKKVCIMKKVFVSAITLATLVGCGGSYDYYEGGVRYTQDGQDCVYYAGEHGSNFSRYVDGLDNDKKIVYRNTRCEDLYARDMFGQDIHQEHKILVPTTQESCNYKLENPSCGCKNSSQAVLKRRYVIVSGM